MAGTPPGIVVTTAESPYLRLTSQAREPLRSGGTVIVDEGRAL